MVARNAVCSVSIARGAVRFWDDDWQSFSQAHPDVARTATPVSPLYCLPAPAIDALGRARRTQQPILDEGRCEAERNLAELCRAHKAVGWWPDGPIRYAPLGPRPAPLGESAFQQLKLTCSQKLHAQQALDRAEGAAERSKGYAGWLLTEPPFLAELSSLKDRWVALPEGKRPSFPMVRPLKLSHSPGRTAASPAVAEFAAGLQQFLNRWELVRLTTWDLPDPQGPCLPGPGGEPRVLTHGVHLILPLHYPLQGDDTLLDQILSCQRQYTREQGLDASLAGLPHYKAYASMLSVLHLERVIRVRCTGGSRPEGLVSRMEEAIADVLGGSIDRVQKLRKAIAACRRGQRAKVAWLRPRRK